MAYHDNGRTCYAQSYRKVDTTFDKNKASKLSKTSDTCTYYNAAENCSITSATITPPSNATVI